MAEPTREQVAEVQAVLNRQSWPLRWEDVQQARRLLHALLSQSTPPAEPCSECLYVEGHRDDCGRLNAYLAHRDDPEPPQIEDMAPGTKPCANPNVNRWYCHRGTDGTCPLPKCIDPSTIHDVTPPAADG